MSNQILKVMNSLKNRVTLIGNLGQDPETKTIESGKKVTHFTLATDDSFKNAEGQKISETTWHNIVAWNGLADIARISEKRKGGSSGGKNCLPQL